MVTSPIIIDGKQAAMTWGSRHPRISQAVHDLGLSRREEEIVTGFVAGMNTHELASDLGIAHTTVLTHFHRIFDRVSVKSRAQLVSLVLARILESIDAENSGQSQINLPAQADGRRFKDTV